MNKGENVYNFFRNMTDRLLFFKLLHTFLISFSKSVFFFKSQWRIVCVLYFLQNEVCFLLSAPTLNSYFAFSPIGKNLQSHLGIINYNTCTTCVDKNARIVVWCCSYLTQYLPMWKVMDRFRRQKAIGFHLTKIFFSTRRQALA